MPNGKIPNQAKGLLTPIFLLSKFINTHGFVTQGLQFK
jgi:hypothetical protein